MCTLPCCGSFCLFVSVISAAMQFVFYAVLKSDSQRLDIGSSTSERLSYAKTALVAAIVYIGFILISIVCIYAGHGKRGFIGEEIPDISEEESAPLFQNQDQLSYASTNEQIKPPISSVIN